MVSSEQFKTPAARLGNLKMYRSISTTSSSKVWFGRDFGCGLGSRSSSLTLEDDDTAADSWLKFLTRSFTANRRRQAQPCDTQSEPASTLEERQAGSSSTPAASYKRSRSTLVASLPTPLGAHAGRVGLANLGNTCFMNSALQCLSHTRHLTSYFLSEDATWETELNVDNPLGSGGALVRAYVDVLKSLWYGEYSHGPIFTPTRFKQTLADFSPMFSGNEQHDAQELATFLLDGLHEDLNRVVGKKPYIEDLGELKEGPRLVEVADCMLIASLIR